MASLIDFQRAFASAMICGDGSTLAGHFRGGRDPRARLAIHLRHYTTSLSAALCDKFPASAWLVGSEVMREATHAYARLHPPQQPCIAEYGREFPKFLAQLPRAAPLPYLASFAELEWAVGQASVAIAAPPLSFAVLAAWGAETLVDSSLCMQPGVHYLRAEWRIDELMRAYLSGAAPESFVLLNAVTLIEVRGARGRFRLTRIEAGSFTFRAALAAGRTVGEAADSALRADPAFDTGKALRALTGAALLTESTLRDHG